MIMLGREDMWWRNHGTRSEAIKALTSDSVMRPVSMLVSYNVAGSVRIGLSSMVRSTAAPGLGSRSHGARKQPENKESCSMRTSGTREATVLLILLILKVFQPCLQERRICKLAHSFLECGIHWDLQHAV